jgi:hypothetical protein
MLYHGRNVVRRAAMELGAGQALTLAGLAGLGVVLGWCSVFVERGGTRRSAAIGRIVGAAAVAGTWMVVLQDGALGRGLVLAALGGVGAWGAGFVMHRLWLEHARALALRHGIEGQGG